MNDSEFQKLTASLRDTSELTLERPNDIDPMPSIQLTNIIVQFLKRRANVKQLNVINFPEDRNCKLHEQLEHEWNIRMNQDKNVNVRSQEQVNQYAIRPMRNIKNADSEAKPI